MAETYVTVGVNRDSTVNDLINHMLDKMGSRLTTENVEGR